MWFFLHTHRITASFLFHPDNGIPKSNVKRKRTTAIENEGENLIKKKKKKQDRPNYFISLPITNPKVGFSHF